MGCSLATFQLILAICSHDSLMKLRIRLLPISNCVPSRSPVGNAKKRKISHRVFWNLTGVQQEPLPSGGDRG